MISKYIKKGCLTKTTLFSFWASKITNKTTFPSAKPFMFLSLYKFQNILFNPVLGGVVQYLVAHTLVKNTP